MIQRATSAAPRLPWHWPTGSPWATVICGVTVLALLVVFRWSIVDSPPYWDFAIGLWTEANFLAETDFDYQRLWFVEKRIWDGGANCYVTSILPTLVALLMRAAPSVEASLVAYHLVVFACAAFVAAAVFAWIDARVGRVAAVLVVAALITNPLYSTQADMLSMELPMTACAIAALWLALSGRLVLAAAAAAAAFLMKATGAIVSVSLVVWLTLLLTSGWSQFEPATRRHLVRGLLANAVVLTAALLLIRAGGHVAWQSDPANRQQTPGLGMTLFWCPDLLAIFLLTAAAYAVGAIAWCRAELGRAELGRAELRREELPRAELASPATETQPASHARTAPRHAGSPTASRPPSPTAMGVIYRAMASDPLLPLAALMIAGTLAAIMQIILLPRYLLLAVPLLFTLAGLGLFRAPRYRWVATLITTLLIAVNLVNWNGALYARHEWIFTTVWGVDGREFARTGGFLERSHEYLADHLANQRAIDALVAARKVDEPVLVGTPFVTLLAFPRLGYVAQPVTGYAANDFTDFVPHFPPAAPTILADRPTPLLVVSVGNTFYRLQNRFHVPRPNVGAEVDDLDQLDRPAADVAPLPSGLESEMRDRVLFDDQLASPLQVYRKTFIGPRADEAATRWYLAQMWPNLPPVERALAQSRAAWDEHLHRLALEVLTGAAENEPGHAALWGELARRYAQLALGDVPTGGDALDHGAAPLDRAAPRTGEEAFAGDVPLDDAHDADPRQTASRAIALACRAMALSPRWLDLSDLAPPASADGARTSSQEPRSYVHDALEEIAAGRLEAAARLLSEASRQHPDDPLARFGAGWVELAHARPDAAAREFVAAIALDSGFPAAHQALGLALLEQGELAAAAAALEEAVAQNPDDAVAHQHLAIALLRAGNWNGARTHLARALELRPSSRDLAGQWSALIAR